MCADEVACPFRFDAIEDSARCRLLEQIAQTDDSAPVRVLRSACEACLNYARGSLLQQHPVFASILYQWSDEQRALTPLSSPPRLDVRSNPHNTQDPPHGAQSSVAATTDAQERANRLQRTQRLAEAALQSQVARPVTKRIPSLDVIVCAASADDNLRAAIASVLDQEHVNVVLHLIDTGNCSHVLNGFDNGGHLFAYRLPAGTSALTGLHQIIKSLRCSWVALQHHSAISAPDRLSQSVEAMEEHRAEFFVCPAEGWHPIQDNLPPASFQQDATDQLNRLHATRPFHPGTLVLRRSTFVDMGGAADVPDDDVEMLYRAHIQGRPVIVGSEPLIQLTNAAPLPPVIRRSPHGDGDAGAPTTGRGFPRVDFACDVVLPFYGQLPWVEEALRSLLVQDHCDVMIHLIDDATPGDTSDFLQRWSAHPNIQVYRNQQNIGQFQTFNNIIRYCHTDHCAVQDADDLSLPGRFTRAAQLLYYTDADLFGGAVELFGQDQVIRPVFQAGEERQQIRRADVRRSFYPRRVADNYFIENPTAVFRTDMFRCMGGFADFGDRLMNRASLDSEFQQRCLFHGVRYAITRDIVVRYRVHETSATQDQQSGWGTPARINAGRHVGRRLMAYERGNFDPRSFGALGRYQHLTIPLN